MIKEIKYLAAPYTHNNKGVESLRHRLITRAAATLTSQKEMIYSPITHCHPMAKTVNLPTDYLYWRSLNHAFIKISKEFIILTLPNWKDSKGIKDDLEYAVSCEIPYKYIDPLDVGITEEMICQLVSLQKGKGS